MLLLLSAAVSTCSFSMYSYFQSTLGSNTLQSFKTELKTEALNIVSLSFFLCADASSLRNLRSTRPLFYGICPIRKRCLWLSAKETFPLSHRPLASHVS